MAFFSWSRWLRSLVRPQVKPIRKRTSRPSMEQLETRLAPAQFVWTGGAGDGMLGTAKNWSGLVAPSPADGLDDLIFQSGFGTTSLKNNIGTAGNPLKINSISFSGNSFTLSGNAITLGTTATNTGQTGQIIVNAGLTETIDLPMTLGGAGSGQQTFTVNSGATLNIDGSLSGTAGAAGRRPAPARWWYPERAATSISPGRSPRRPA